MARAIKEAIVIVVDVGLSVREGKPTFLQQSKECVSRVLQRKIFSRSKDELSLVLCGSPQTVNRLYDGGDGYEFINIIRNLQTVDWKFVDVVSEIGMATPQNADWLDALVVAADHIAEFQETTKYSQLKIVLFSDLATPTKDDQVDEIVNGFKLLNIDLTVIGPDIYNTNASKSANIMAKILEATDGLVCSFSDAIPQLLLFPRRSVRPTPWNVNLEIDSYHHIPVSGYCKIREAKAESWKTCHATDKNVRISRESTYHKVDEQQTPVEESELISGYLYGTTLVPFSKLDTSSLLYDAGPKSFRMLGVTKTQNIALYYHLGNGAMIFTGQKGNPASFIAVSAFARALYEMDTVAIVRRVYNARSAARIGALYPIITDECEGLSYIELPFAEDVRHLSFSSLKMDDNTNEDDAMDGLIDAMDLSMAGMDDYGVPCEVLRSCDVLNPQLQHLYRCLALKALDPKAEVPDFDNPMLLEMPHSVAEKIGAPLEKIKKTFPLKEIPRATWSSRKGGADIFKLVDDQGNDTTVSGDISDILRPQAKQVSSVTPVEDFKVLLANGEDFKHICDQMKMVIERLAVTVFSSEGEHKVLDALRALRSACIDQRDSNVYNTWLHIKKTVIQQNSRIWSQLKTDGVGLITSKECSSSSFNENESEKFYDEIQTVEEPQTKEEDMSVDDLLDEM